MEVISTLRRLFQMSFFCEELNESSGEGELIPCSIQMYSEIHSITFKTQPAEPVLRRTRRVT